MARLSLEDWDMLTEEEKELRKDEMPQSLFDEQNKDMIIIDGVARPRKDFEAEILRKGSPKIKEDIMRELKADPKPGPVNQPDVLETINSRIQGELNGGVNFPTKTILGLINRGIANYVSGVKDVDKKALKVIKQIKRDLRKKHNDFADYEDEFDDAVEEIHPTRVTEEALNLLFDAIRGRHVDDVVKRAEERGRIEGGVKIVGASEGSGTIAKGTKSKLTPEQASEAEQMEIDEASYLKRLNKRRQHAKELGCTIMPQTCGESLRRPVGV